MTTKARVYASLEKAQEAVCDDCLVSFVQATSRQVARAAAVALAETGAVVRSQSQCAHCGKSKTVSRVAQADPREMPATPGATIVLSPDDSASDGASANEPARPWYWEGSVQAQLLSWLRTRGYAIQAVADTAARTAGKDIVAVDPAGRQLWVSVKGYPDKSKHVQARHWFAGAVFDIVLYRNETTAPQLAVAFPDGFTTYHALAARMAALRAAMPFTIYWVAESGEVRVE